MMSLSKWQPLAHEILGDICGNSSLAANHFSLAEWWQQS